MDKASLKCLEQAIITLALKSMKVAGHKIKCVDMESISMQMVPSIKESGKITSIMGEGSMNFQMGLITKVIGKVT